MSTGTQARAEVRHSQPRLGWAPAVGAGALLAAAYLPVFGYLGQQWWDNEYFQHGPLIPLLAGYLLWRRREALAGLARRPSRLGLALVAGSLAVLVAGHALGSLYTVQSLSLLGALVGSIAYLYGWGAVRAAAVPLAFLGFAIPWPWGVLEALATPLQRLTTSYTALAAGLLALPVQQRGVDLFLGGFTLTVAVPCSGLKSAIALLALAGLYAAVAGGPPAARLGLLALAVPVALAANVARVLAVLLVAQAWGPGAALGFYHWGSGVALFALAWLLLAALGRWVGCRPGD